MEFLDADWLGSLRRMVAEMRGLFDAKPTIAERTVYEGVGEGGDQSLELDRRAEDVVFAELERMHGEHGLGFTAISEERGEVVFGDGSSAWRIVIDPVDGSMNLRRTIPAFALSVAFADGDSMADVELGFVHDFGPDEEFWARTGEGAWLDGRRIDARGPGYGLEVVGLESAQPRLIAPLVEGLDGKAFRIRSVGAIAISVVSVAAGRFDGMLTARDCRSVDIAAAQLICREAGAELEFPGIGLGDAGLGLDARYGVAAALDAEMLATLREVLDRASSDAGAR